MVTKREPYVYLYYGGGPYECSEPQVKAAKFPDAPVGYPDADWIRECLLAVTRVARGFNLPLAEVHWKRGEFLELMGDGFQVLYVMKGIDR